MTITLDTNNGPKKVLERDDYSTEAFICNVGGKLEATIQKDTSLSGNGSTANPLAVALSPNADNAITDPGNGLYAIDYTTLLTSLVTGWVPVTDTWTYLSATTFTVPSNATLKYQKGDKIRYKQGAGFKYGVVLSVSATVLEVWGWDDYSIANAAVTDIAFSREARPYGYPEWFNYSSIVTIGTQNGNLTNISILKAEVKVEGLQVFFFCNWSAQQNAASSFYFTYTLPAQPGETEPGIWGGGIDVDGTGTNGAFSFISSIVSFGTARLEHAIGDVITAGAARLGFTQGFYKLA